MYSFTFTKKAEKKFRKMDSIFQKRLIEKLKFLKEAEDIFNYFWKLENLPPYTHRLRIWDMRILFTQNENDLNNFYIVELWKRWDIYN